MIKCVVLGVGPGGTWDALYASFVGVQKYPVTEGGNACMVRVGTYLWAKELLSV